MSRQLIKKVNMNSVLMENYKSQPYNPESPILGTFKVEITDDQVLNQNNRHYRQEVWEQPNAFGKGGKFLNESGELRQSRLVGNVDHPTENTSEVFIKDAAIVWQSIKREDNGKWFGEANILNLPEGRIIKTWLDYIKQYGGGEMIGVSTRALGDSVMVESHDGYAYEEIVPDNFEVIAIDFVYNPSNATSGNPQLLESKKRDTRKTLNESIQDLIKADNDNADYYKQFIVENTAVEVKEENMDITKDITDKYIKELKAKQHEVYNTKYEIENMSEEDYANSKFSEKYKQEDIIKMYGKIHDELKDKIEKETTVEVKTEGVVSPDKELVEVKQDITENTKQAIYDLRKGGQAEDFKKYLRDRGLYFEPSENGNHVTFVVNGADEFVDQRAQDIVKHFGKLESTEVLTEETNEEEKHDEEVNEDDNTHDEEVNEEDDTEDEENHDDEETEDEEENADEDEEHTEATLETVLNEIKELKEYIELLVGPLEPAEIIIEGDETDVEAVDGPEEKDLEDMTDEELEDLYELMAGDGGFEL